MSHEQKIAALRRKPYFRQLDNAGIERIIKERDEIYKLALIKNDNEGIDNFAALCEEASVFIARNEGLRLSFDDNNVEFNEVENYTYDEDEYGVVQAE